MFCASASTANPKTKLEELGRRKESARASEDRGERNFGRSEGPGGAEHLAGPPPPSSSTTSHAQSAYERGGVVGAGGALSPATKLLGTVVSVSDGSKSDRRDEDRLSQSSASGLSQGAVGRDTSNVGSRESEDEVNSGITSEGGSGASDGRAPPLRSLRKSFARTFGLRGAFSGKYSSGGP